MAKRLLTVSVVTRDLAAALAAWERASALAGQAEASPEGQRALLQVGDIAIDLLSPSGPGGHALEERGEGLYSLTIETDSFAGTVDELRRRGVFVSDEAVGPDGRRGALLDPASTHGVPIRLVEKQ